MSKIFITDGIDNPNIEKEILGKYLTHVPSQNIEILINWNQPLSLSYLENFPNLKSIIRCGVGYDHIDIKLCKQLGIVVCNDPCYCTEEVSNTAIAMILNGTRGISRYDELCRDNIHAWQNNIQKNIIRDSHLTVGIIGFGRIGKRTLEKCNILGYKTCFYDPYVEENIEKKYLTERKSSLKLLLKSCDVISLHCPLTEETKDLVDESFLSFVRPHSILINTARGKLIKDMSLIESSLRNGHLSFVGLDVLPSEPPRDYPLIEAWIRKEKWISGRLIVNPHTSFYSQESVLEVRRNTALNALGILQGKKAHNRVF